MTTTGGIEMKQATTFLERVRPATKAEDVLLAYESTGTGVTI
jgi:hypothetical protein